MGSSKNAKAQLPPHKAAQGWVVLQPHRQQQQCECGQHPGQGRDRWTPLRGRHTASWRVLQLLPVRRVLRRRGRRPRQRVVTVCGVKQAEGTWRKQLVLLPAGRRRGADAAAVALTASLCILNLPCPPARSIPLTDKQEVHLHSSHGLHHEVLIRNLRWVTSKCTRRSSCYSQPARTGVSAAPPSLGATNLHHAPHTSHRAHPHGQHKRARGLAGSKRP